MHHLSREKKLKKVRFELSIDDVQRDREVKTALRKFVSKFLDSDAESDNDVGTTSLVFH